LEIIDEGIPVEKIESRHIAEKLISYSLNLTETSRNYMESNPGSPQPSDYKKFPGKVDHTTCIVIRVCNINLRQLTSDLSNLVIRLRQPIEQTTEAQPDIFSGYDLIAWIKNLSDYANQAEEIPQMLHNFNLLAPVTSHDSFTNETFSTDLYYHFKVYEPIFTLADWKVMLHGSTKRTFNKGDVIIKEGSKSQKIYHITFGSCRVVKKGQYTKRSREVHAKRLQSSDQQSPKKTIQLLGRIGPPQTLGEISLLLGGCATASVIADSDEVEVLDIDKGFIDVMFVRYPDMAGRFYHYLASVLARRLSFHEATD